MNNDVACTELFEDVSPVQVSDPALENLINDEFSDNVVIATGRGYVNGTEYQPQNATRQFEGSHRSACVQSEIAEALKLHGFQRKDICGQLGMQRFCEESGKTLRFITMKGKTSTLCGIDVVKHRQRGTVYTNQVVAAWRLDGENETLFDMGAFIDPYQRVMFPWSEIETISTWVVVWEPRGKHDNVEIFVFLARPASHNEARKVLECSQLIFLGSIKPFAPFDDVNSPHNKRSETKFVRSATIEDVPSGISVTNEEVPTFDPEVRPRARPS